MAKAKMLQVRVTVEEYEQAKARAAGVGVSLSEFVRDRVLGEDSEVVHDPGFFKDDLKLIDAQTGEELKVTALSGKPLDLFKGIG